MGVLMAALTKVWLKSWPLNSISCSWLPKVGILWPPTLVSLTLTRQFLGLALCWGHSEVVALPSTKKQQPLMCILCTWVVVDGCWCCWQRHFSLNFVGKKVLQSQMGAGHYLVDSSLSPSVSLLLLAAAAANKFVIAKGQPLPWQW